MKTPDKATAPAASQAAVQASRWGRLRVRRGNGMTTPLMSWGRDAPQPERRNGLAIPTGPALSG